MACCVGRGREGLIQVVSADALPEMAGVGRRGTWHREIRLDQEVVPHGRNLNLAVC